MKKLLSVLILLLSTSANGMDLGKDSRVLNLDGCTGFIVDGNYILTAKHCLDGLGEELTINGVKAKLVYVPNTEDGPIVYHIAGPPQFKSFKVAKSVPKSGSLVYSIGYPGSSYAILTGKMIGGNSNRTENSVGLRVNPGHSGGPLLSEEGEVVGVALSVSLDLGDNHSNFASWGSTVKAVREAKERVGNKVSYKESPRSLQNKELVIFSYVGCGPCENLDNELDYAELKRNGIKVTKVILDGNKWSNRALVSEFKSVNGKSVNSFPTIWLRGSGQYQVGYKKGTKLSVLGWVINGFKSIGLLLFGSDSSGEIKDGPEFTTPNVPGPILEEPPIEPVVYTEEVDWENVSIVIAARAQTIGYVRGKALEVVLRAIKGPIKRANAEYFEGKANIVFVDERTQPLKYASLLTAAGVDVDKFYVMVLVKEQSLGLKGFIAGKVESSILKKLPEGVPVEIIFQRIHEDSYFAITQSLEVSDVPLTPIAADGSMKEDIINALKAELSVVKNDLVNRPVPDDADMADRIKANILPAILEAAKSEDEDGTERTWMMRLMAGLMGLVGAGQGVSGIRGFLLKRGMAKVKEKLGAA